MANDAIARSGGRAVAYFKFTCVHCGVRCTFAEPNTLYEKGECSECGQETTIEKAGFMLVLTMAPASGVPLDEIENNCPHGLPIDFMYPCLACENEKEQTDDTRFP